MKATRVPLLSPLIRPVRLVRATVAATVAASVAASLALACAHPAVAPSSGPARSARADGGLTSDEVVRQTLNRLTFGVQPGDGARIANMGIEHWLDVQLAPASIADSAVER